MLGWSIAVYRQAESGLLPATSQSSKGLRLALWQAGLGGRDWLRELVKTGNAIDLGGDGYPCQYTATAEHLIPQIIHTSPATRNKLIDSTAIAQCPLADWLLVEAWDES